MKDIKFEGLIFVAIFFSSIKLVIETYVPTPKEIDYFLAAFFLVEAIMKAIAFGFVVNKNSYLRESWS